VVQTQGLCPKQMPKMGTSSCRLGNDVEFATEPRRLDRFVVDGVFRTSITSTSNPSTDGVGLSSSIMTTLTSKSRASKASPTNPGRSRGVT